MTIKVKGIITRLRVSQAFLSFKYRFVVFFCLCPGQNLFHRNLFIAFSSTRFCPISLTRENRKAQVGKAPAERWGSLLGMRLMENGSHVFWENFSKVCLHIWWGDSLESSTVCFQVSQSMLRGWKGISIHTMPRILPRYQVTFRLWRESTLHFTQTYTFKIFSIQISIFQKLKCGRTSSTVRPCDFKECSSLLKCCSSLSTHLICSVNSPELSVLEGRKCPELSPQPLSQLLKVDFVPEISIVQIVD